MIYVLRDHPITVMSAVVFALAFVKGGPAERWGGGAMVLEWVVEWLVDLVGTFHGMAVVPTLMLDFALAVALLVLALRYGRLWLGAAMIIQSVMLALHAMALSDDSPAFYVYATFLNACTCLIVGSLLLGLISSWRRRSLDRADRLTSSGAVLG